MDGWMASKVHVSLRAETISSLSKPAYSGYMQVAYLTAWRRLCLSLLVQLLSPCRFNLAPEHPMPLSELAHAGPTYIFFCLSRRTSPPVDWASQSLLRFHS